jgi:2-phosphoglycerate kinase
MKPRILLIGGAAGVGKSTISLELAHRLGIKQVVDVDSIREVLRGERNQEECPYLFYDSFTAWKHKKNESRKAVIESFIKYCKTISKSVKRIIERADVLGKDVIIEGIQLMPSLFKEYLKKDNVKLIIIETEYGKHTANFCSRKKEFHNMDISEYMKQFKKIRQIHDFIVFDAKKNRCITIKNINIKKSVNKIAEMIK